MTPMHKVLQSNLNKDLRNAIKKNDLSQVKSCLKKGAKSCHESTPCEGSDTPLQLAIIQDNAQILQHILDNGADPNKTVRKKNAYFLPPVLLCVHYNPPRLNALRVLISDSRTKLDIAGLLVKGLSVPKFTAVRNLLSYVHDTTNPNIQHTVQQSIDLRNQKEYERNAQRLIKSKKFGL